MTIISRLFCTLLVALFAIILQVEPSLATYVSFDWMEQGSLLTYRLASCHVLHWSWNHLAWDLLMFVVLGAICEKGDRLRYVVFLCASALLIPIVVIAAHPELSTYRGLSGIDSGLFSLVAVDRILDSRHRGDTKATLVFSLCLVGLIAKIALEMLREGNLFVSDTAFVPVPIAHLTGAVIGAITCLVLSRGRKSDVERSDLRGVSFLR